jgi:hypothetical protein
LTPAGFATGVGNCGLPGPVVLAGMDDCVLVGAADGEDADVVGRVGCGLVGGRVAEPEVDPWVPPELECPPPPNDGTVAARLGSLYVLGCTGGAAGSTTWLDGLGRMATTASPMSAAMTIPPTVNTGMRQRRRRAIPARICR